MKITDLLRNLFRKDVCILLGKIECRSVKGATDISNWLKHRSGIHKVIPVGSAVLLKYDARTICLTDINCSAELTEWDLSVLNA